MISLFLSPILAAICMSAPLSLLGAFLAIKRRSLLGESLTHAAYPGLLLGACAVSLFDLSYIATPLLIFCATVAIFLGGKASHILERKYHFSSDASLSIVLSSAMGIGILLASRLQFISPTWYRRSLTFFFGQVATIGEGYLYLYALLAALTAIFFFVFSRKLQIIFFDEAFSHTLRMKEKIIYIGFELLLAFSIALSVRSVGVVLLAGMLIIPPIGAQAATEKFYPYLFLSVLIGVCSSAFGTVISFAIPEMFFIQNLPLGPLILLSAAFFTSLLLLFAPVHGLFWKQWRRCLFHLKCVEENILKTVWKAERAISIVELFRYHHPSRMFRSIAIYRLKKRNELQIDENNLFTLTLQGRKRAIEIVRLHRLWEVYLASFLGVSSLDLHDSAEEMEHILTPEMEQTLVALTGDVSKDPHNRPIPPKE